MATKSQKWLKQARINSKFLKTTTVAKKGQGWIETDRKIKKRPQTYTAKDKTL